MSSALMLVREIVDARFSPAQNNLYLFYASDGENSSSDREATQSSLDALLDDLQYGGFLEVGSAAGPSPTSEIGHLFLRLAHDGRAVGAFRAGKADDIWAAVRHFFGREQAAA
jgi:uncharacterized sporulation protein YeaH/YhbH (DUF444 family)